MDKIRVAIWGFGAMGSGIGRMIAGKKGIEISGVCDKWDRLVGQSVYDYLGIERGERPDVVITDDERDIVDRDRADVVILATDSFVHAQFDKLMFCIDRCLPVISTAEEMAWPWAQNRELADRIDRRARERGVAVLGTGINPGFVLDYLILALTGTCTDVRQIEASRINDLAPFGTAVMKEQGVGITTDAFKRRLAADDLAGHVGFPESIAMMAAGMDVDIDTVEQTKEPIVTSVDRTSPYGAAPKGHVAGIRQQGYAKTPDGEIFIRLDHPQQICPEAEGVSTGDYITVHAPDHDLNLSIVPETPGGIGTIAMIVNMIPQLLSAKPGLRTMLDLPVPRAILGDFAKQVNRDMLDDAPRREGEYVEIMRVILTPEQRAPQVPEDTKKVPLVALLKGFLLDEAAHPGEEVEVKTMSGRTVRGVLTARDTAPVHNYGRVIPELLAVRRQVRDLLFGGEEA